MLRCMIVSLFSHSKDTEGLFASTRESYGASSSRGRLCDQAAADDNVYTFQQKTGHGCIGSSADTGDGWDTLGVCLSPLGCQPR